MILTVTPNPAIHQTVFLSRLNPGELHRFRTSLLDPSGGGINVSRMAQRLGWPTLALGFAAGETGRSLQRMLDVEGVQHHFVQASGETRLNVTVTEEDSQVETRLRGPGPVVDSEALARLDSLLRVWLQVSRVLVLSGRLPPGMPDGFYASYVSRARAQGVTTILDAEEDWLRLGVAARPDLIKPSVRQAEGLLGHPLPDVPTVVQGALELARRDIPVVVVSMGARGAIGVERGRDWKIWRATPPPVEQRSTTGAGDSMVAGLAVAMARGESIADGLRLGTAAGTASAMTPGAARGTADAIQMLLPQVRVEAVRRSPTRTVRPVQKRG